MEEKAVSKETAKCKYGLSKQLYRKKNNINYNYV